MNIGDYTLGHLFGLFIGSGECGKDARCAVLKVKTNNTKLARDICARVNEVIKQNADAVDSNCARSVSRTAKVARDGGFMVIRSEPLRAIFDYKFQTESFNNFSWVNQQSNDFVDGFRKGLVMANPRGSVLGFSVDEYQSDTKKPKYAPKPMTAKEWNKSPVEARVTGVRDQNTIITTDRNKDLNSDRY